MATVGNVGGASGEESGSESPKNKVKFLCSHGGKILPRPADGHLKYVGGETRVVAVPRDVSYAELMKRLTAVADGDMVLKYQLIPEDLDALISVRSDDDLKHMFDEYHRHNSEGTPRLRAFLFPSNPVVVESHSLALEPHALEQRYVDAINGVIRTNPSTKLTPIDANLHTFSLSSACSSPNSSSTDGQMADMSYQAVPSSGMAKNRGYLHKVQSSPSLCSLNNPKLYSDGHSSHHAHQHHYHHYHRNHPQQQLQHNFHHAPSRLPRDLNRALVSERLPAMLSMGSSETHRSQMSHGLNNYSSASRHHRLSTCCGCPDESGPYECAELNRSGSVPRSPRRPFWE